MNNGILKSREIHKANFFKRIIEYDLNPKLCKRCESPLPYSKRTNIFCSQSCVASYNNVGVRRHGRGKIKCHNPNCAVLTYNVKYCSNNCQNKVQWAELKKKIESGNHTCGPAVLKKYLIETRGHKCEMFNNRLDE